MKTLTLSFTALLAWCAQSAEAGPITLFDNGSFSGPQELRNNACGTFNADRVGCLFSQVEGTFTVYEDFVLGSDSTVTRIEWHQIETPPSNYLYTTITIWNSVPNPNSGDGLLLSFDIIADKVLSLNEPPLGSPPEYSALNSISGLDIDLGAGSYWLGIHNEWQIGGVSSWSQTLGGSDTISGRYQSTRDDANPLRFYGNENSAFRILGNAVSVPEPPALVLLLVGLIVVGSRRLMAV